MTDQPAPCQSLPQDVQDWIEFTVELIMQTYEEAGTPLKGGAPIFEAMCKAYQVGRNDQISRP
jgi:hypothetical protein